MARIPGPIELCRKPVVLLKTRTLGGESGAVGEGVPVVCVAVVAAVVASIVGSVDGDTRSSESAQLGIVARSVIHTTTRQRGIDPHRYPSHGREAGHRSRVDECQR